MASIKNRPKLAATQSKQAKNSTSPKATLQPFMQENIDRMHRLGKVRTGETYTCTRSTASCVSARERMYFGKTSMQT